MQFAAMSVRLDLSVGALLCKYTRLRSFHNLALHKQVLLHWNNKIRMWRDITILRRIPPKGSSISNSFSSIRSGSEKRREAIATNCILFLADMEETVKRRFHMSDD